jgi:OPA family glycerol-3-phosphate transporter-like MFS transporter
VSSGEWSIPAAFREPAYRLRRFQNWILVGLLYSFFYMSRYNFAAAATALQDVFGWSKADLGIFETLLPLIYGLSVVVNGPLTDRIGGRKAFLWGAAGVVVMSFLFGALSLVIAAPAVWVNGPDGKVLQAPAAMLWGLGPTSTLWIAALIWTLNGYFQSFGALAIVKINAQWFHRLERGTFSAIFGILIRFGLILAFSGTPLILGLWPGHWELAFWIPGGFVLLLFLANCFFVVDRPKDAGFGDLDTADALADTTEEERPPIFAILKKVFTSKVMWMLAVGSMMIGLVRRSVVDAWWPVYFRDVHGVSGTDVAFQVVAWGVAILGIAGGFAMGILSDRVYQGRRAPLIVYGFVGMALCLGLFLGSDALALGPEAGAVCLILLSFFVNGAHGMVGGAASMDFGGRKAAATAAGLFDGMQYLASAVTGTVVGNLTEHLGWQAWKVWPIPFALVGAIVISRLWKR